MNSGGNRQIQRDVNGEHHLKSILHDLHSSQSLNLMVPVPAIDTHYFAIILSNEGSQILTSALWTGIEDLTRCMPFISPAVKIDGVPYLDGGCSCKIPYQWALDQGFGRILVIRTREVEFRKANKVSHAALRVYRRYPAFAQKLSVSNLDYNQQCDNIERLHEEGRLMRLAPSKTVIVSRVEKDVEKLGELYHLGRTDCFNQLDEIYHYLTKR